MVNMHMRKWASRIASRSIELLFPVVIIWSFYECCACFLVLIFFWKNGLKNPNHWVKGRVAQLKHNRSSPAFKWDRLESVQEWSCNIKLWLIKHFHKFSDHRATVVSTIHSKKADRQQLKMANRENRIKQTVRAEHTLMLWKWSCFLIMLFSENTSGLVYFKLNTHKTVLFLYILAVSVIVAGFF